MFKEKVSKKELVEIFRQIGLVIIFEDFFNPLSVENTHCGQAPATNNKVLHCEQKLDALIDYLGLECQENEKFILKKKTKK